MNFPSVSQFSIAKGTGGTNPPEMYIPLWWHSGSYANTTTVTSGVSFLSKGTTTAGGGYTSAKNKLHTLNGSWSSTLKYALELTLEAYSGIGAYAELWDMTTNTGIASSQINTTSSTFMVMRSGQFTLTPGHVYGVTVWASNSSYNCYITDASLIVFPS